MSDFYQHNAKDLAGQYNTLRPEDVHASWKAYWPAPNQAIKALDVGAGSGRDAKWLAEQGAEVYAVEPSEAMRDIGKQTTKTTNSGSCVSWLDDSLPGLTTTHQLGLRFDLILISAVWMHIPTSDRERAFRKLSNLLAPNGKLVITLRHGEFSDGRVSHGVSIEELESLAKKFGLLVKHAEADGDFLKREEVWWETVVLQRGADDA